MVLRQPTNERNTMIDDSEITPERKALARHLIANAEKMTERCVDKAGDCVMRNHRGQACIIGSLLPDEIVCFLGIGSILSLSSDETACECLRLNRFDKDSAWFLALENCQCSHDRKINYKSFGQELSDECSRHLAPWLED
jgi:hypothetical protein